MKKFHLMFILFFLSAPIANANAGWVIQVRYSDSDGNANEETIMIQDNKLRSNGIDGTFIFDLENDWMMVINDTNNTCWQVKISESRESYYLATRKFMDKMLVSLPPQEREMYRPLFAEMEKMYANFDPSILDAVKIRIEKTVENEIIAGFNTNKYLVYVDDTLVEQKWLVTDLDLSNDLNLGKMVRSFKEISPITGEDVMYQFTETYLDLSEKGFEMRSVNKAGEITEVMNIEKKLFDADLFSVPEGFRQISIEEMLMMEMNGEDR
ncbi:MAG: DUF4412 domain-containing protein [Bacteroidales bacterium]|nr:DUF4412 domain-containing protein [Bacteroidales bacterium]